MGKGESGGGVRRTTYHNINSVELFHRMFEQRNLLVPSCDITLDRNRYPAEFDDRITHTAVAHIDQFSLVRQEKTTNIPAFFPDDVGNSHPVGSIYVSYHNFRPG